MTDAVTLSPAQRSFLTGYLPAFSDAEWDVSPAGQAGSQRNFLRIKEKTEGGRSFILIVWDGNDEDWPRFLAIPAELGSCASFLPEIHCADPRHGLILEEDLGDETLKRHCDLRASDAAAIEAAYRRVIDALFAWQSIDSGRSVTVASRAFDEETFLWETDYFARRYVVDFCGCERLLDAQWESERRRLAAAAASLSKTIVHRDFQSENIMLRAHAVRFVDFQGARLGPPAYDLASLLYDPYAPWLSAGCVERLFAYYRSLDLPIGIDRRRFDLCAAQRLMQALGAYGNLSIHKGKLWYREYVPVALARLGDVLERLPEFPAIRRVVEGCSEAAG